MFYGLSKVFSNKGGNWQNQDYFPADLQWIIVCKFLSISKFEILHQPGVKIKYIFVTFSLNLEKEGKSRLGQRTQAKPPVNFSHVPAGL